MFFASFHLEKKNDSTHESSLKYIYSCTIGLASEFMKKKKRKMSALFYIKKASLQIWVKKGHIKQYKKKIERQRSLMRFLEIRLLFDGLFHYFSQLQAVDFVGEGSSVPAEPLQAVSQLFTVSVEPPGVIHHLVQLLILVFSSLW